MADPIESACPTRIVSYADGSDVDASRTFYTEVLGLEVAMEDPVLGLVSPSNRTAQVVIPPIGSEQPQPQFGIDLGHAAAVDHAHEAALRRGLRVVYPITDEPWGVRRFFVEDPGGTIINVLAHTRSASSGRSSSTTLLPRLIVADPDRASDFYQKTLDAERVFTAPPIEDGRPGVVDHRVGDMFFRISPSVAAWGWLSPGDIGGSAVLVEVQTDEPDAVGERMLAEGAELVVPIANQPYGQRSGRIRDPFGHLWIITGELR